MLVEKIELYANLYPNRAAIVETDCSTITYSELAKLSTSLADSLLSSDVTSGSTVGVYLDRGADMIVAVIAAVRVSLPFITIDTAFPKSWLDLIIGSNSIDTVVVKYDNYKNQNIPSNCSHLYVNNNYDFEKSTQLARGTRNVCIVPKLCSGSAIEYEFSSIDFIYEICHKLIEANGITEDVKGLFVSPASGCLHLFEFFIPLLVGGSVIVMNQRCANNTSEQDIFIKKTGANMALKNRDHGEFEEDKCFFSVSCRHAIIKGISAQAVKFSGKYGNIHSLPMNEYEFGGMDHADLTDPFGRSYNTEYVERILESNVLVSSAEVQVVGGGRNTKLATSILLNDLFSGMESAVENELRRYVATMLPQYMRPAEYIFSFGTSADFSAYQGATIETLSTTRNDALNISQRKMLDIWYEILPAEVISIDDDFYLMGGDSILAITLALMVNEAFDLNWTIQNIEENRTIREQCSMVDETDIGCEPRT